MADGKTLEWLDAEVKKIWNRLVALESKAENIKNLDEYGEKLNVFEKTLATAPASFIQEAENASKQTSTYYNRAKTKCNELDNTLAQIGVMLESLKNRQAEIDHLSTSLKEQQNELLEKMPSIRAEYETISSSVDGWREQAEQINEHYTESETLLDNAKTVKEGIQDVEVECNGLLKKITSLHSQVIEKRNEVEELHQEVFGYDYDDEQSGESKHEDGLKVELEGAYESLKKQIKEYSISLDEFKKTKEDAYDEFLEMKKNEHTELKKKIEYLLPDALTAGLSSAYAEKAKKEEAERSKATKYFRGYVGAIIAIALIPVFVSCKMYFGEHKEITEIISLTPKLALMVFPIYAPLIWLAVVANKKMNLAKRLIEEYSHKEVLSKTFEGLSKQVEAIGDERISSDLRARLLYNMVAVSSENPGKLISNYNKSDNPIMDVLDKSISLGKTIEKLQEIPGLSRVVERLVKSNSKKQETIKNNINMAMDTQEEDS